MTFGSRSIVLAGAFDINTGVQTCLVVFVRSDYVGLSFARGHLIQKSSCPFGCHRRALNLSAIIACMLGAGPAAWFMQPRYVSLYLSEHHILLPAP